MRSCWLKDASPKSSCFRCITHGKKRKNSLLSIHSHQRCRPHLGRKAYGDVVRCRNKQIGVLHWPMYWKSSPIKVARCSNLMISLSTEHRAYSLLRKVNSVTIDWLKCFPLFMRISLRSSFHFLTSLKYCHSNTPLWRIS